MIRRRRVHLNACYNSHPGGHLDKSIATACETWRAVNDSSRGSAPFHARRLPARRHTGPLFHLLEMSLVGHHIIVKLALNLHDDIPSGIVRLTVQGSDRRRLRGRGLLCWVLRRGWAGHRCRRRWPRARCCRRPRARRCQRPRARRCRRPRARRAGFRPRVLVHVELVQGMSLQNDEGARGKGRWGR